MAISADERLYNLRQYKELFETRAADCIQPDISHAGPVANAATLQLAASCTNFSIPENMYSDLPRRTDVTNEELRYEDGYIYVPDKPGIGTEFAVDGGMMCQLLPQK